MRRKQTGVSLIEALVALVILGFGLLGATRMQVNLTGNAQVARQRAEAVQLAKSKIEVLRSTATCVAESGNYTPPQGSATFTITVTCPDSKSPQLVVSWNDAKGGQAKVADAAGNMTVDNRVELNTTLN